MRGRKFGRKEGRGRAERNGRTKKETAIMIGEAMKNKSRKGMKEG